MHALEHAVEKDRVILSRVRAPQENQVRLLDFRVGGGPATCSKHRRQTDDAGSVSSPVTTIDVVRAEAGASELAREKIHLVRALRAAEDSERFGPTRIEVAPESFGGSI